MNRQIRVVLSLSVLIFFSPVYTWQSAYAMRPGQASAAQPVQLTLTEARVIKATQVLPQYPRLELAYGIEGTVVVLATVRKNGSVKDARILHCAVPAFGEAVQKAVKKWRYDPALLEGRPVESKTTVVVHFTVRRTPALPAVRFGTLRS